MPSYAKFQKSLQCDGWNMLNERVSGDTGGRVLDCKSEERRGVYKTKTTMVSERLVLKFGGQSYRIE